LRARSAAPGAALNADALVLHAMVIAVAFGLIFTVALLGGGRWLYGVMGGSGAALDAALTYSNVVFCGAVLLWIYNSLANVIRGTGNMAVPAIVTCAGVAVLIPLSPCLILGWGPFPALGIAGGAFAVVAFYSSGASRSPAIYGRAAASFGSLQGRRFPLAVVLRHSQGRGGCGAHDRTDQPEHRVFAYRSGRPLRTGRDCRLRHRITPLNTS